jgi:hypothetical protein
VLAVVPALLVTVVHLLFEAPLRLLAEVLVINVVYRLSEALVLIVENKLTEALLLKVVHLLTKALVLTVVPLLSGAWVGVDCCTPAA